MKRSQIALLSVGGVLAGIVIVSVVSARMALSHGGVGFPDAESDAESVADAAGLRGFDGVEVVGRWRVDVSRGDDWRVDLSYPEDLADSVTVRLRGDRLRLGFKSGLPWNEPGLPVTADIVMPELDEVEVRGAAVVEVSGFRGRRLEVDIAGAARLEGLDGRYDELELSVAGASDIDLRGIAVTDAEIDLAGASNIRLTMDGGVLSGSMAGAGSIEYSGSVAAESVRVAGAARVERVR